MLDKMDDDRPTALRDRDAALDAQQIGSAQRRQHRHGLFESRPAGRLFEDSEKLASPVRVLDPPNSKLRRGPAGSPSSDDNEVHNTSMFLEAASCRQEVQTRTPTFERTTRGYRGE
jgi:hypothetical protein